MQTFSDRLRWAMAQRNPPISQAALAARVGMRPQSINYLCNPSRNAKGSRHTYEIASVLGVSPEWLATGVGTPHRKNRLPADTRVLLLECLLSLQAIKTRLEHAVELLKRD
ncbi:helix-turn-helix transcriptional regulator [Cupriavidus gilardii]|uniref:Helix-turn-helix transcriptional regulator n=1 Tax=Cupriavidus gilardii TaxID=82541 RepID=A0ABY4VPJ7_9BURK|nr:helix-turn-helix transcriptional regulator [Cupriavidus gilardii]USE78935.1 helix-turn-helix transcriptional regulator [Cupriavidus gilardii]UXC38257.1 helix-turn-helix transcriptional regulator [Cupriavidus gilardii]